MRKKILLTKQGYEGFEIELARLKKSRPDAVTELQRTRELGDLSENNAYRVARQKLIRTDRRIAYLTSLLRNARIQTQKNNQTVQIGSIVVLEIQGATTSYTLVDSLESDIQKGLLSAFSPIGKAIIGRVPSTEVTATTPSGNITVRILAIN